FKQASGLDVVIVPFRTTPDAIVALMRNDVGMGIDFYAALKSGLEDNKLRAVAWTGPQPSPALPNVPTALGEGVKGFEAASWNAIYAQAGTPPEVLATLNKAMQEVLAEPDVKKRLLDLGIDSKASTPAEMDAQMRGDITKWTEVIARAAIEKRDSSICSGVSRALVWPGHARLSHEVAGNRAIPLAMKSVLRAFSSAQGRLEAEGIFGAGQPY